MTSNTTEPALPEVGTVIPAKPWAGGHQLDGALRGLVLARYFPPGVEPYIVVWFPELGPPALGGRHIRAGSSSTIQGLWQSEIGQPCQLAAMPEAWILAAERAARRTHTAGGYNIGTGVRERLERAARDHRTQHRRARRATRGRSHPHAADRPLPAQTGSGADSTEQPHSGGGRHAIADHEPGSRSGRLPRERT